MLSSGRKLHNMSLHTFFLESKVNNLAALWLDKGYIYIIYSINLGLSEQDKTLNNNKKNLQNKVKIPWLKSHLKD